jgi:uncharacterized protein
MLDQWRTCWRAARTTHDRDPHTVRAVPDVEAALREAERFGGKRQMGPERAPTGLVAGYFTDPRANLTGVAGPA